MIPTLVTATLNAGNDVTLASVVSYSSENYSAAKAWEMRPSNEDLTF